MANIFTFFSAQRRRRWLYGLLSVVVALSIVVSTPSPSLAQRVPRWLELLIRGAQIVQLSNLSDRQEVELGGQINAQLTSQQFRLYRDSAITNYVDQIGQRLVPASDRPNIPYTFQVVDNNQINAFATMGGYVYITTGLLRAADNEAQLASVLGHEIGHIVSRHAVEQMRERAIQGGIASVAGLDRNQAIAIGVELAVNRPNSRRDELEADQLGLNNMVRAGYAPSAMVAFMEKLRRQGSVPSFLSTHPAVDDRITALQGMIDPATANSGDGLDNASYRNRISRLR